MVHGDVQQQYDRICRFGSKPRGHRISCCTGAADRMVHTGVVVNIEFPCSSIMKTRCSGPSADACI